MNDRFLRGKSELNVVDEFEEGGCEGARRMRRIHRGDATAMLKARSDFDMGDVTQQAEGSVA